MLVIADGGLPAMVAALLGQPPEDVILWVPPLGVALPENDAARLTPVHIEAARGQGEALSVRRVEACGTLTWPSRAAQPPTAAVLLLACEFAARTGCTSIIWPVVHGENPDRIFASEETASLVSRLATLSMSTGRNQDSPIFSLPLVDLTPRQVADLALDLNVPTDLCWWTRAPKGDPAGDTARWIWESALSESARSPRTPNFAA